MNRSLTVGKQLSPSQRRWFRKKIAILRDNGCPHSPVCPEMSISISTNEPVKLIPWCIEVRTDRPYPYFNEYAGLLDVTSVTQLSKISRGRAKRHGT